MKISLSASDGETQNGNDEAVLHIQASACEALMSSGTIRKYGPLMIGAKLTLDQQAQQPEALRYADLLRRGGRFGRTPWLQICPEHPVLGGRVSRRFSSRVGRRSHPSSQLPRCSQHDSGHNHDASKSDDFISENNRADYSRRRRICTIATLSIFIREDRGHNSCMR